MNETHEWPHRRARDLPATAIPNVAEGILSGWGSTFAKVFTGISLPQAPNWFGTTSTTNGVNKKRPSMALGDMSDDAPGEAVEIELAGDAGSSRQGTKAERRSA